MSARAAACPSCGGEVLFSAGSTLVAICPQCRSAVARKGVDLESIGVAAELVPTDSPFRVGQAGRPKKRYRPFRIVGRMQMSYGEGTWDEWHLAFTDGTYAWLSEAQGQLFLMLPLPTPAEPPPPEWEQLQPGLRLAFQPYGAFTVTDRRQARYVAAEGELPFVAPPGAVFSYADLSGADGSLATLDYGDDPGVDAFFAGQQVEIADLGIEGLAGYGQRKVSTKAASLNCPNCGAGLKLNDPQATVRVACPYCGSLLSAEKADKFEVLDRIAKVTLKPFLPLGASGTLRGSPYVVLGVVQKTCTVDGTDYFWREYLLKETKREAYHWLAESTGHWILLAPIPAGKVAQGLGAAVYDGRTYKHFTSTVAVVDQVLGEFYWRISRGETTTAADYVSPPRMLSSETAENEVNWTEGEYVPKEELEAAFKLKEPLPVAEGVGACQPWPRAGEAKIWWRTARILALAATVVFVLFQFTSPRKVVFEQTLVLPGTFAGSGDEAVYLSNPFPITRTGNVRAEVYAETENNWVGIEAALIEESTGVAYAFHLASDWYHGVDGGESWSEGAKGRTTFLSHVTPGSYVVRIDPDFDTAQPPPWVRVKLTEGVPSVWRYVLVLLFLFIGPMFLGLSYMSFESRRWAQSDHSSSGGDSGGDSDDSGGDE